jgi:DNA repair protein RadC
MASASSAGPRLARWQVPPAPGSERGLSEVELVLELLPSQRRNPLRHVVAGLVADAGGVAALARVEEERLVTAGLSALEARRVRVAFELARRILAAELVERIDLSEPSAITRYLDLTYSRPDQEVMGALYLTPKNRLIATRELFRGTFNRCAVHPHAFLRHALLLGADRFVAFHTHPSGDPTPSQEDLLFTCNLADAARLLGLKLTDHLVLGAPGRWTSLQALKPWDVGK